MKLVERTLFIAAPPARVYELLTDAELLAEWIAPVVVADPRPGGELRWAHQDGDTMIGSYVELVPDRRVAFTFGWERDDIGVPAGSTVVEIELRPKRGGTELRLVHRGLAGPMSDAHGGGWDNYLTRLGNVAEGGDAGPDALAGARVPTADPETRFWLLARPLLEQLGVTRSTMMGFACLRLDGDFFASIDHRTGSLVVKLDEPTVDHLLDTGDCAAVLPERQAVPGVGRHPRRAARPVGRPPARRDRGVGIPSPPSTGLAGGQLRRLLIASLTDRGTSRDPALPIQQPSAQPPPETRSPITGASSVRLQSRPNGADAHELSTCFARSSRTLVTARPSTVTTAMLQPSTLISSPPSGIRPSTSRTSPAMVA